MILMPIYLSFICTTKSLFVSNNILIKGVHVILLSDYLSYAQVCDFDLSTISFILKYFTSYNNYNMSTTDSIFQLRCISTYICLTCIYLLFLYKERACDEVENLLVWTYHCNPKFRSFYRNCFVTSGTTT